MKGIVGPGRDKKTRPESRVVVAELATHVAFLLRGTLAPAGTKRQTGDGQMRVLQRSAVKKRLRQVDEITISGPQGMAPGQTVPKNNKNNNLLIEK